MHNRETLRDGGEFVVWQGRRTEEVDYFGFRAFFFLQTQNPPPLAGFFVLLLDVTNLAIGDSAMHCSLLGLV